MKILKNLFVPVFCFCFIFAILFQLGPITDRVANALEKNPKVIAGTVNAYKKDDDFLFVQNVEDFVPLSYGDILNIYYTITNNGYDTFTFYCPSEYKNCLKDVEKISNDPETLTYINNFVHPFNGFSNMQTIISESGEINVKIHYLYTEEEIHKINDVVTDILINEINASMTDYDKIKVIHDYIINHTKYDVERNTNENSPYLSYKAYGALLEGYATCNGYTDAMAIFLERLGFKNFKVATELMQQDISGHVWNAVYLNDKWYHLDLTWDDPVSSDGVDHIQHKYFLITDEELQKADTGEVVVKEHLFNKRIYPEFRN